MECARVRVHTRTYVQPMLNTCNLIGLGENKTVDSAQPRKRSIVTRPLSSREGGVWGRDYRGPDLGSDDHFPLCAIISEQARTLR